jgi:predicted flap endonuclease-1-like 5' DNA nuclease
MEQISENQASLKYSKLRAQELSDSLKETFERRDELQGQAKDLRGNLDKALAQRDRLKAEIDGDAKRSVGISNSMKEKDDKIFYLSRELQSWQGRVPPLVERFRVRDLEAQQVEAELERAKGRISELENLADLTHTRVETVDRDAIADDLDASNDQYDETAEHALAASASNIANEVIEESIEGTSVDTPVSPEVESSEPAERPEDNLKLIKGVGPAIEKTLHELGIYRFNQIADMSEFDIDRVAQRLRGFRSRIYREDWVGQARTLEYQKNNDPA